MRSASAPFRLSVPITTSCRSESKSIRTPGSTFTVAPAGMDTFWHTRYGLPASVHVTVCPAAGIAGWLHGGAGGGPTLTESIPT
jgi:hypothetical protein